MKSNESMSNTPAARVSGDLQKIANMLTARIDRVSGAPGSCGFVLLVSTPNETGDLRPDMPGRVHYVSNTDRKDGARALASVLHNWSSNSPDLAYHIEKVLAELRDS